MRQSRFCRLRDDMNDPQTLSEWRQVLREAHPDHGGSLTQARDVIARYRTWREKHRVCALRSCRRPFVALLTNGPIAKRQRFCRPQCARHAQQQRRLVASVAACLLLVLGQAGAAQTPAPVKNPSVVVFECPDHDRDTDHEIDILRASDGAVIQTLQVGDPPADGSGNVTVKLNVQPIAFGTYWLVVRAVVTEAGTTVRSVNSANSDTFERVPGPPGKPRFGG